MNEPTLAQVLSGALVYALACAPFAMMALARREQPFPETEGLYGDGI